MCQSPLFLPYRPCKMTPHDFLHDYPTINIAQKSLHKKKKNTPCVWASPTVPIHTSRTRIGMLCPALGHIRHTTQLAHRLIHQEVQASVNRSSAGRTHRLHTRILRWAHAHLDARTHMRRTPFRSWLLAQRRANIMVFACSGLWKFQLLLSCI